MGFLLILIFLNIALRYYLIIQFGAPLNFMLKPNTLITSTLSRPWKGVRKQNRKERRKENGEDERQEGRQTESLLNILNV